MSKCGRLLEEIEVGVHGHGRWTRRVVEFRLKEQRWIDEGREHRMMREERSWGKEHVRRRGWEKVRQWNVGEKLLVLLFHSFHLWLLLLFVVVGVGRCSTVLVVFRVLLHRRRGRARRARGMMIATRRLTLRRRRQVHHRTRLIPVAFLVRIDQIGAFATTGMRTIPVLGEI